MKFKLGIMLLVIVIMGVIAFGCVDLYNNKTTGGGWFLNGDGNKVTFGFNVQPVDSDGDGTVDAAKGEFTLLDHAAKLKVKGTFTQNIGTVYDPAAIQTIWFGTCVIDGEEGMFLVSFVDNGEPGSNPGDTIGITIFLPSGDLTYNGVLGGGNIQVH